MCWSNCVTVALLSDHTVCAYVWKLWCDLPLNKPEQWPTRDYKFKEPGSPVTGVDLDPFYLRWNSKAFKKGVCVRVTLMEESSHEFAWMILLHLITWKKSCRQIHMHVCSKPPLKNRTKSMDAVPLLHSWSGFLLLLLSLYLSLSVSYIAKVISPLHRHSHYLGPLCAFARTTRDCSFLSLAWMEQMLIASAIQLLQLVVQNNRKTH